MASNKFFDRINDRLTEEEIEDITEDNLSSLGDELNQTQDRVTKLIDLKQGAERGKKTIEAMGKKGLFSQNKGLSSDKLQHVQGKIHQTQERTNELIERLEEVKRPVYKQSQQ